MSQNNKIAINSAHSPGLTCLAFSRDGKHAFTGGEDTLVRIWRTDQGADQEPDVAFEAGEPITSVAPANDCWLSGSADSDVRRYEKGKPALDGLVTSVNGVAIRCVSVNPKGNRVAVTSDELGVRLIDLDDTVNIDVLQGHSKSVRRATWHPSGSLLTTSGADGKIIVWDVSDDEPKEEKVIEGVIPAVADTESPEFAHDCSAIWHTSGQYFIVASRSHEIVAISRSTWTKSGTFSDDSISGATTALALSANGVYLATASKSGVAIWSTQTRRLLFRHTPPPADGAVVVQLAWSPSKNLIAWTDTEGVLTRWTDPIPSSSPDPVRASAVAAVNGVPTKRRGSPNLFGEDDGGHTDIAAGAEGGGAGDLDLDNDDWIIDDLGGGMDDEPRVRKGDGDGLVREMVSITKAQPPFQPGSTPMENKKRYLVYNMIGVVEVTDQDTHHIVNVEFHDRSLRKSYHFTDHFKYTLASLGERGALFACEPEPEHPAQVLYKPYGAWAAQQSEWTYTLRDHQHVLGVAAGGHPLPSSASMADDGRGQGNIVVATSEGDLTFLAGGGGERRVVGLEGEFVAMIAGAEWVFVVCRAGATTIDGSQNLMGTLISFDDFTVLQRGMLPIPKGHTLKWLGITEEGAPVIYDSTGYLHVLTKHRLPLRGTWARVLDTNRLERKQGKDESYWPVGVSADKFSCLILKGRQQHPGFPRPLIQELPMCMPFRRTDAKETSLEEHFQRDALFLDIARPRLADDVVSTRELALDKELVQLIQTACKADRLPRALELTRLLFRPASLDMAIRVAQFYHLVGLQEKMEALKTERERAARESDDDSENEDDRARKRSRRRETTGIREGSTRPKPFEDFGPPPRIDRPGLGRSTDVVVETTRFSKKGAPMLLPVASTSASPPTEGKRKRNEEDSLPWDEDTGTPKRRIIDESDSIPVPPPPKPTNPFARKAGQENGGISRNSNPFARKADGASKPIQKSESFFDKVDAAESEKPVKRSKGKEKEKDKKDGRQMTLFGLMPGAPASKKGPKKKGVDDEHTQTQTTVAATQQEDGSDAAMPDTQPVGDTQTQTVLESQTDENLTQNDASPEPIEWPESPQPTTAADEEEATLVSED